MKQFILALLAGAATLPALAQKVSVEQDVILVDGQPYAHIEQDGCGIMDVDCQYYVKSLQNQRLFVVKQHIVNDPTQANASNPQGRVLYLEYVFTAANARAEASFPVTLHLRALDVARKVVKAGLLKGGELDTQAANDFVVNNGTPFSDRLRGNTQTIIVMPGRP